MLTPGTKLGPYEIVAAIGQGGMGEVYRARDSRLGRDVAIKVSAERFSDRFEREARAIAALNHPHICTLHDVGPNYLVMELVDGPTLADRITEGPVPLVETLRIARQIAAALDAAHTRGIVHRDLKPSNVKLTADGAVKVLDFGLAKQPDAVSTETDPEQSPTVDAATRVGLIVGTAAYMAPEQARGLAVDKRADIWAFGVVVYEMLAGARLFQGDTATDTIAAMLTTEPRWDRVPAQVRPLLQRCLVKDPKQRLRDIGDLDLLLAAPASAAPRRGAFLPWAVAAVVAIALAALAAAHFREQPTPSTPIRFQFSTTVPLAVSGNMALSPDGRQLAFLGTGADGAVRVWIRAMDSLELRQLPGSETAFYGPPFFWSPDGRYIAYDGGGVLKRLSVGGGLAQKLCDLKSSAIGGSWNRLGDILIGNLLGGVLRVPQDGGTPVEITRLDPSRKEDTHLFPIFLPDDRHFLYYRIARADLDRSGIYVGSLDRRPEDQDGRRLLPYAPGLTYASAVNGHVGHLLFVREGTLVAQPFDERGLTLAGDPFPVAQQVGVFLDGAFVSASRNGVLAFRTADPVFPITWYDRRGNVAGRVSGPGRYTGMALSPDGSRVVASLTNPRDTASSDLWLLDGNGNATPSRFTFDDGLADYPIWSPDGRYVAFRSGGPGRMQVRSKPVRSGTESAVPLSTSITSWVVPSAWSPDGRFLIYAEPSATSGYDLWLQKVNDGRAVGDPIPLIKSRFNEDQARFSPDGRWVAYTSNESGTNEVYVRAFTAGAGREPAAAASSVPVSRGGGSSPRWRKDGKELFYLSSDERMMVVPVTTTGSEFRASQPTPLFQTAPGTIVGDVSADGQRFLLVQSGTAPFTVLMNWAGR